MIKVEGLTYCYSGLNNEEISFPDFSLTQGSHCLLLGESGSGKTTLLHLLGGLLRPSHGKIEIVDEDIALLSETELDQFRAKHLGFIFQKNHLISALTVKQNLLMAPFLAGKKQDFGRIEEVLGELGLSSKYNSKVTELSQGQAQRVAIARAMINKPALILADEPTSSLDDKNCQRVIDLLLSLANQNKSTLLVATHDQRLKERFVNRIEIKAGSPQSLLSRGL
jgi:ABC-type lipoprotein export system ATPase subunit